jgi:hypothetical protein
MGILMERMKVSMDEAFDVLVYVSQHNHRKLRDVADQLVFSGELADTWVRRRRGTGASADGPANPLSGSPAHCSQDQSLPS